MSVLRGRSRWMLEFLVLSAIFLLSGVTLVVGGGAGAARAVSLGQVVGQGEGKRLYEARCASCHGEGGQGTALAPPIVGLGPAWYDFMLSTGRMPLDRPVAQASRKEPAFDRAQINALISYLVTLPPGGGIPIPQVAASLGDLASGQGVFQLNCAPCHGTTGNGGAVGPQVAPPLHVATPTQIAEAIRVGPGAMPVFDETTITQHDLNSVVRYVLYLRKPEDAGGASLNHSGPIVEGLVGLLVGLGAIVLVIRYIGSRA